jgi:hypothetical protein
VNHYYFYCIDEDFGPFFLKFCSYFPYNALSSVSTDTNTSSGNWNRRGSPTQP